jgi:hypothetical protein
VYKNGSLRSVFATVWKSKEYNLENAGQQRLKGFPMRTISIHIIWHTTIQRLFDVHFALPNDLWIRLWAPYAQCLTDCLFEM